MSYLTASELAELVGYRPNQKSRMVAWLSRNGWRYAIDVAGNPKVARAYHDRKMGICDGKVEDCHADSPDLTASEKRCHRR